MTSWTLNAQKLSGSDSSVMVVSAGDQITYSWHNVNVYSTPDAGTSSGIFRRRQQETAREKHILKDVTGICRPGELLAIMGASGAGKTTLLNVLTHRNNDKLRITGDLFVNGRSVDPDALTSRSAYVQQDDLFIGMLTVREQLIFQAMLRMDRHLTYDQRMTRVDEVIIELGLTKCAETKIGVPGRIKGISGGEMKRLAFACEVLTNPPLMFCDEPTSGLDSFMAQNVVAVMKNMTERGKTIISTIHQPSSEVYAMFDRVLLMAEGRVAFLGEVDAAYQFFSRYTEAISMRSINTKAILKALTKFISCFGISKSIQSDQECQNAFTKAERILCTAPILLSPDFSKPFKLQIDACESRVRAVLLQSGDDGLQPVAYFSAKYQPHQRTYSTIEKEALALILALENFEVYVRQTSQNNSAIFQHVSINNHNIHWEAATIKHKSHCKYKCKIIESVVIATTFNFIISQRQ
nr:protein white-like [Cherax quadricarinatus]